jgi:hypothetical protein
MTSTSGYSFTFSNSPLSVLASTSQKASQALQQIQFKQIEAVMQDQLGQKLLALQPPVDQVSIDYSQSQIDSLQTQQTAISKAGTQFGQNGLILSDLSTQLTNLSTAAANGDSAGFDAALDAANGDIGNLGVVDFNPIFQNDGVANLKNNGLGVQSSATYDLSTPAGQSAAATDISNAQTLVNNIMTMTTSNQVVGGSQSTALNGQISALQNFIKQQENASNAQVAAQTKQLTQNMQNQLHIIELNLGKTSQVATALGKMLVPSGQEPKTTVYSSLQNAIGQTASNAQFQMNTTPPIMSLFA